MSASAALALTLFFFLLFAVPVFYVVFYRSRGQISNHIEGGEVTRASVMEPLEIELIEKELGVVLPDEYAEFLQSERPECIDSTAVIDHAQTIIEMTLEYRRGLDDLPLWPDSYVYVGDESDACPYVIDCSSGRVMKLDKGDFGKLPISEFESFSNFVSSYIEMMRD